MRGVNDDEIADFVELTRDRPINVRFIEYMPFDGNVWSDTKMVTYKQMMAAVQQRFPHELQRLQVWVHLMFGGCTSWQLLSVSLTYALQHVVGKFAAMLHTTVITYDGWVLCELPAPFCHKSCRRRAAHAKQPYLLSPCAES